MGPDLVLQKTLVPTEPIPQYSAIAQTGNESGALPAADGDFCPGFAQDEIIAADVADGRGTAVRIMGISRAVAEGALTVNARIAARDDGTVGVAAAGQHVIGRCVTPVTTAGDWTAVFITHEGPAPA